MEAPLENNVEVSFFLVLVDSIVICSSLIFDYKSIVLSKNQKEDMPWKF